VDVSVCDPHIANVRPIGRVENLLQELFGFVAGRETQIALGYGGIDPQRIELITRPEQTDVQLERDAATA
jgi:hypothetical protein